MERVGEEHISEKEGLVICNRGRREMLKPDITGTSGGGGDSKDGKIQAEIPQKELSLYSQAMQL